MKTIMTAALLAATTLTAANAQFMGWKGDVAVGASVNTGNTETEDYNASVDAKRDFGAWALVFDADASKEMNNDTRSGEKYSVGVEGQRKIDSMSYMFGSVDWENDNFSGYESVTDYVLGYGRKLYATNTTTLDGKVGIGYRNSETELGDTTDEFIVKPELAFMHKFSDAVTFTQKVAATIGEELTVTEANSKLSSALSDNLALNITFDVTNKDEVPADFEETDTKTGVSVGYKF